jgi:iron complex outermembrane recepter protein
MKRTLGLRNHSLRTALLAAGGFVLTAPVLAQEASSSTLQEVVVTATKRTETVKEVPGGVTAITGESIQNLGINNFQDYMSYVPSLSINAAGSPGHGTVILRGLNSGWEQTTPTVGFYINDTPFTPSSASSVGALIYPDPDLANVERVEVLKGPQSTLWGASTLGGLIKIVTKRPDLNNFGGDLAVSGMTMDGGGSGYGVRGDVNIPVVQNTLAVRLGGFDRHEPGYVDNVLNGQNHTNSYRVDGGTIDVRWAPTSNLDLQLSGFIQDTKSDDAASETLDPNTLQPLYGKYKYSSFFLSPADTRLALGSLTVNYDTGMGTLTSVTSYAHYDDNQHYDYTASYGILFPAFGITDPNAAMKGTLIPTMKKFTEELRFSSTRLGRFQWLAGLFYTHESVTYDAILNGVLYPDATPLPDPFYNVINALTDATYKEYAAFGDLTFYLTDRLDFTAGMRYSHNDQDSTAISNGLLVPGGSMTTVTSSSDSDESYLFTLRWRPTDHLSTYVRAASAYRPGGPQFSPNPQVPASFGPDTVWNYEIGAKGQWLDGHLNANIAAYHIDWNNIQLNALVGGLTITGNGGKAESNGAEFDAQFEPIPHLVFGATAAYVKTRMNSVSSDSTAGAVVGDSLPYTPKWAGSLTGDYAFPLANGFTPGVGASWIYQGSRPSSFSDDQLNTKVTIPSYNTLGLRAHLDWKNYSLLLHLDNVTNEHGYETIVFGRIAPGQPFNPTAVPILPRTIGLTASAHF